MLKENAIRPLAVAIIKHNGKLLAGIGKDSKKGQTFYRLLGGGIEFGEKGEEALRREFREELESDLENIKYITTLENIFTFEGKNGHEIVMIFEADLVNKELYSKNTIPILDLEEGGKATWENIEDYKNKKLILYPEGVVDFV